MNKPFHSRLILSGLGEAKVKHALWTQHAVGCSRVNVSEEVSNNSAAVTSICDPSSICGIALRWLIGKDQGGCLQLISQACTTIHIQLSSLRPEKIQNAFFKHYCMQLATDNDLLFSLSTRSAAVVSDARSHLLFAMTGYFWGSSKIKQTEI